MVGARIAPEEAEGKRHSAGIGGGVACPDELDPVQADPRAVGPPEAPRLGQLPQEGDDPLRAVTVHLAHAHAHKGAASHPLRPVSPRL